MKPQASNIPSLRFPEFDGEWSEVRLGDIAQFRRGSFPQPYGLEKWYDDELGSPFVQVFDVGENFRLKPLTKRKISKEAQELSVFVGEGTLVLTLQGSIGRLAITQYDAFVDRTLLIFESFSIDTNEYFFMYSVFLLFQREKQKAPGGTIKTITKEVLSNFRIFLPSVSEQNKIGNLLQSVDERIDQLTTKKELLLKYKKGVIQQIFDQKIRFKDDDGNDFPDWEERKLGDVARFSKGAGISKGDTTTSGLHECIRYGELYTHYAETIDQVISRTNLSESELSFSNENDVIIPSSGETNVDIARAACVLRKGIALGGDLTIIRSNLNGVFLSYYLNSKKKYDIARLAQGVSVVHLYPIHLSALKIEIPSIEEQRRIADFLSLIDKKIALDGRQIEATKALKKGLLQQMFV